MSFLVIWCPLNKTLFELGWNPKWNLDKALEKTVNWYKSFYNGEDVFQMSLKQIEEYEEGALFVSNTIVL